MKTNCSIQKNIKFEVKFVAFYILSFSVIHNLFQILLTGHLIILQVGWVGRKESLKQVSSTRIIYLLTARNFVVYPGMILITFELIKLPCHHFFTICTNILPILFVLLDVFKKLKYQYVTESNDILLLCEVKEIKKFLL